MQASASEAAAALPPSAATSSLQQPPTHPATTTHKPSQIRRPSSKVTKSWNPFFSQIASLGLGSKPGQYTTNLKKSHDAKLCQTQGFKIIELLSFFSARTSCYFSFFRYFPLFPSPFFFSSCDQTLLQIFLPIPPSLQAIYIFVLQIFSFSKHFSPSSLFFSSTKAISLIQILSPPFYFSVFLVFQISSISKYFLPFPSSPQTKYFLTFLL